MEKAIALCWIPSHVGIHGYEKADSAAFSPCYCIASSELLPRVTKLIGISEKWQKSRNNRLYRQQTSVN